MTQNKKKGIAKKALSISLVAAMLATSNVPAWASFEAVDDGAGFTVEESAVTATPETTEETAVLGASVNTESYDDSNIKVAQDVAWGTAVTVTGSLLDSKNQDVKVEAVWLADGVQAAGSGATQSNISTSAATYTPVYDDYGKALSLRITVTNADGGVVYENEFSAGTVQAKDISQYIAQPTFSAVQYDGTEQKVIPDNYAALGVDDTPNKKLTSKDFDINYSQKDNDFTNANATDKISVTYTVNAPGYVGTSQPGEYAIAPKAIAADDFVLTLKKTSFEYTGSAPDFTKDDITLVEKKTGKDVTASVKAVKPELGADGSVKDNNKVLIYTTTGNIDTTLEATKAVWENYSFTAPVNLTSENSYSIVARDLSKSTAVLNQVFSTGVTAAQLLNYIKADLSLIEITGQDGKTVTLDKLTGDTFNISLTSEAQAAITAQQPATVKNGVVVAASGATKNYTGQVSMDLSLAGGVFGDVTVGSTKLDTVKPASVDKAAYKVAYNTKAFDLRTATNFSFKNHLGSEIAASNYDITYEPDNVNAGIIKATITGKDSFAGNTKVVYFAITPADIAASNVTRKDGDLTINYSNDKDASLYKDAFGLKVETTLDGKKVTLTEGTDYTVKYFYTTANQAGLVTTDVSADGQNTVGNYVTAKITIKKDGNFKDNGVTYVSMKLAEKSMADATIVINPESYTYTGKAITPSVIVKDGSRYLYADTDYTLKLKNNINAGTATATVVAKAGSGYKEGTEVSKDFTITPAKAEDVKIMFAAASYPYTGRQIKPVISSITLNGVNVTAQFNTAVDRVVYGENISAGKDMGSVTVSPKNGNTNFEGTKTATFDIKGKPLTGALKAYDESGKEITATPSYRYTGSAITFAKTAFVPADKTLKLTEGVDYEIVYIDNVYPAGTGKSYAAVVAKGNYEGANKITAADGTVVKNVIASKAFTITGATFDVTNVTVNNGVYAGGVGVKPAVTVKVNDFTLVEGKDFKLANYPAATDATVGKPYDVDIVGIGAWAGSNPVEDQKWGIDKRDLKDCDITVVRGTTTVKIGEVTVKSTEYTVKDNGDGTYTISAAANSKNLTGSATVTESTAQAPAGTTVKVTGRSVSSVSLSWDKVSEAEGYTVWYKEDGQTGYTRAIITSKTSFTKNGLKPGTKYYFIVKSWIKDNGKYVFSEPSRALRGTTKPETATIKAVTVNKNGDVKVKLTGAAAGADKYAMCYSTSKDFSNYKVGIRTSYTTRTMVQNLKPGTYYVKVRSYVDLGSSKVYGNWSSMKTVVVK